MKFGSLQELVRDGADQRPLDSLHARARAADARPRSGAPDFAREQLAWGAGPRATQFLILGAKARAWSTAGRTSRSKTSAHSPSRCCGIASS